MTSRPAPLRMCFVSPHMRRSWEKVGSPRLKVGHWKVKLLLRRSPAENAYNNIHGHASAPVLLPDYRASVTSTSPSASQVRRCSLVVVVAWFSESDLDKLFTTLNNFELYLCPNGHHPARLEHRRNLASIIDAHKFSRSFRCWRRRHSTIER